MAGVAPCAYGLMRSAAQARTGGVGCKRRLGISSGILNGFEEMLEEDGDFIDIR
jgi:hypothetical protein